MTNIRITADLNIVEVPDPTDEDSGKGAVCEDGSTSTATGSGACAWHGGVKEWKQ